MLVFPGNYLCCVHHGALLKGWGRRGRLSLSLQWKRLRPPLDNEGGGFLFPTHTSSQSQKMNSTDSVFSWVSPQLSGTGCEAMVGGARVVCLPSPWWPPSRLLCSPSEAACQVQPLFLPPSLHPHLLQPSCHPLSCPQCTCTHPTSVGVQAALVGLLGERTCARSQSRRSSGRRWNFRSRGLW